MKISSLLLAGVMLASSAGLAVAQAPAGGGGGRGAPPAECTADMAKFCADKTGPDARQCRTDNMSKFSDACQTALKARAAAGAGRQGGGGGGQYGRLPNLNNGGERSPPFSFVPAIFGKERRTA